MRRVIEGTQASPITVRPADLTGTNHDFSYFRHVRFTGDWAGRSLRYVDLVQSRCNADLRRADVTGIEAWHTNCEGVRLLPEQADTCSFDFVRAYIMVRARSYMENVMSADSADINTLWNPAEADAIPDREKGSRSTLMERWRVLLKTTQVHIQAMFDLALDDLPNMTRANHGPDAPTVQELRIFRLNPGDREDTVIPESQFSAQMLTAIQNRNRWALARAAESVGPVPLKVLCRRLNPGFNLTAVPSAMLADPEQWDVVLDGNTSDQRLRTLTDRGFF